MRGQALSRDAIVAATLALIEGEGLEAFSTRKLGARLGLQAMSLYHYFSSRDALLDAAVDRMIAEIPLPDVARTEWRAGLLRLACNYRAMGHRHLNAAPLLALRCPSSPAMQRFLDTLSALLTKAGLSAPRAETWLLIQRDYVVGSLMADHAAHLLVIARKNGNNRDWQPASGKAREQAFKQGFVAMLDAVEREC